eukprot:Hpha_TRINITY_DN15871_c1_g3::TRINITY_DN15871_c1_g3_i1::g.187767::m.187767/K00006/GPD1; glycerol-3-phosphate dehydrogenase (NAD+)
MGEQKKLRVALLGSGNWGCAIARIVGWNILDQRDSFEEKAFMYVYEEMVRGRKLTEIINTAHENVKYLPGYKLPENIVATADAAECVRDADIIVVNMPHQVLPKVLASCKDAIKPGAVAVSLIKGHVEVSKGSFKRPVLGSDVIKDTLGVEVGVLMGANVAKEVAKGDFCECTLAVRDTERYGKLLKSVFHRPNFNVTVISDVAGTELCGGLKNVVALGAGFCDGLMLGSNAKAAVMRTGLLEMSRFVRHFFPTSERDTMFESCGVADLITTSVGGRNRKCAEAFARDPSRKWSDIEKELLGGQKLQGVSTAIEIMPLINAHRLNKTLPLMRQIYRIAVEGAHPSTLFDWCKEDNPGALVLGPGQRQKKVALLGSGNWGSCIARIIGQTCSELEEFEDVVKMYVHEEIVDGRKLSDVINTDHENVKYLPGVTLPENILAVPSAAEAARGADVLVVCLPHQYLPRLIENVNSVRHTIPEGAIAINLIKGLLDVQKIELASSPNSPARMRPCPGSEIISEALGMPCAVLMGANVANEISRGVFAETTIATRDPEVGEVFARLFHLDYFRVNVVRDVFGVELCSGLANIYALGAGFCDGLGLGGNTKAAIIRIGLLEIWTFTKHFFPEADRDTLFESCGVGDLIAMAFGGRNRLCAEFFANTCERMHRLTRKMNKEIPGALGQASERGSRQYKQAWAQYTKLLWQDVEEEVLGGQYIQGIRTLTNVWPLVQHHEMQQSLPLLCTIHRIALEGALPSAIVHFASDSPPEEPIQPGRLSKL